MDARDYEGFFSTSTYYALFQKLKANALTRRFCSFASGPSTVGGELLYPHLHVILTGLDRGSITMLICARLDLSSNLNGALDVVGD
jgi:hypothetical protein